MKILLIYYTGTYNTRYLTEKIKSIMEDAGDTVETVEINSKTPPCDCFGYDLIGFSYPIYGFNAPLPFDTYVKKLAFSPGQKYFVYKNSGETLKMNNSSSRILHRIMKKNGAAMVGEYHFVMPYNIHFPFERDFIRQIFDKNEKLAKLMIHNLKNGIVKEIKSNLIYDVGAFFVGIQKIGGNVNSFLYRVDEEKCLMCGKCIKECPHENIYIKDGKIAFHHHCDMCMRCSFYCPTNAIKIGFLEGWKVNGAYDFAGIEADHTDVPEYINENSQGFYKCFINYFAEIDKEYDRVFRKENRTDK